MADMRKEVIAVIEQKATHIGVPRLYIPLSMLMQIVNFGGVEDESDLTEPERAHMKLWNLRVTIEAEEVAAPTTEGEQRG